MPSPMTSRPTTDHPIAVVSPFLVVARLLAFQVRTWILMHVRVPLVASSAACMRVCVAAGLKIYPAGCGQM